MKNKSVTYLLITVVAAIWGLVFYRIFNATNEEENFPNQVAKPIKTTSTIEEDTFELINDYRDPFLGSMSSSFDRITSRPMRRKVPTPQKTEPTLATPPIDWSFVSYLGTIWNKQTNKEIGILKINGNEVMVASNDRVGEITVLKVVRDSVVIVYQGVKKGLRKTY